MADGRSREGKNKKEDLHTILSIFTFLANMHRELSSTKTFLHVLGSNDLPALAAITEKTVPQLETTPLLAAPLLLAALRLAENPDYMPLAIDAAIKVAAVIPEPRFALEAVEILLDIAQDPKFPNDKRAQLAASASYLVPTEDRIANQLLEQTTENEKTRRSQIKLGWDAEFNELVQGAQTLAQRAKSISGSTAERPQTLRPKTPPHNPGNP